MSVDLIGTLSVGVALAMLTLALWRSVNARIERLDARLSTRVERLENRIETLDARQYETAQVLARIEARQRESIPPPTIEAQPLPTRQRARA